MPDREKVIEALETCRDQDNPPGYRFTSCVDDCPYNGNGCARKLKEDALALLKEQEDEKPVLDEFGRCFLNALKRQFDMKLQMIELLITPEFAEKVVELIEKMFD